MVKYSPTGGISHILSQYEESKKCGKEEKAMNMKCSPHSVN